MSGRVGEEVGAWSVQPWVADALEEGRSASQCAEAAAETYSQVVGLDQVAVVSAWWLAEVADE